MVAGSALRVLTVLAKCRQGQGPHRAVRAHASGIGWRTGAPGQPLRSSRLGAAFAEFISTNPPGSPTQERNRHELRNHLRLRVRRLSGPRLRVRLRGQRRNVSRCGQRDLRMPRRLRLRVRRIGLRLPVRRRGAPRLNAPARARFSALPPRPPAGAPARRRPTPGQEADRRRRAPSSASPSRARGAAGRSDRTGTRSRGPSRRPCRRR